MISYMFQNLHAENFAFYLYICSNLPVKFANFKKVVYFLTVSTVFSIQKEKSTTQ